MGLCLDPFLVQEPIIATATGASFVLPESASRDPASSPQKPTNSRSIGPSLVHRAAQDVLTTASRRAQPRTWMQAVTWLVASGLHPKANSTTLEVAKDLATRMDYQRGVVLYDLDGTVVRTKQSRATVKRHVGYLRELGALVWLIHGSKRNLRLPGRKYTATATVYGAVIPPCYDEAMGHRIAGHGYESRKIGVTEQGRAQAITAARATASPAPKRRTAKGREPHSRTPHHHGPLDEVGGKSQATLPRAKNITSRRSILGRRVTALSFQVADRLARRMRPLHNWTQRMTISELSWVLVDRVLDGYDEFQIDRWLRENAPAVIFGPTWRPASPHRYLAARLAKEHAVEQADHERATAQATAVEPMANAAWRELCAERAAAAAEAHVARTVQERQEARLAARWDIGLVIDHLQEHGEDDALDLYGTRLTAKAAGLAASRNFHAGLAHAYA